MVFLLKKTKCTFFSVLRKDEHILNGSKQFNLSEKTKLFILNTIISFYLVNTINGTQLKASIDKWCELVFLCIAFTYLTRDI